MLSRAELAELDRACYHEAGHQVVGTAEGCGPATINISGWPLTPSFRASCRFTAMPDLGARRVAYLSGSCAETLAARGHAANTWAAPLFAQPLVSAADRAGAGAYGDDDLKRAMRMVVTLWPSIAHVAQLERQRWFAAHTNRAAA